MASAALVALAVSAFTIAAVFVACSWIADIRANRKCSDAASKTLADHAEWRRKQQLADGVCKALKARRK